MIPRNIMFRITDMFSLRSRDGFLLRLVAASYMTVICLGGCVNSTVRAGAAPRGSTSVTESPVPILRPQSIPAIRYGRYALVELMPDKAQRDLMEQVVDVILPESLAPTVGDALHYILLRSGYQLCDDRDEIRVLDTWPVPAALIHIGPLTLHDALQLLVGPGWHLEVDDSVRRVCFARSSGIAPSGSSAKQVPPISPDSPVFNDLPRSVSNPERAP